MVRPGSPACISRVRLLGSEGLVAGCRESLSSCAPSTCPCHGCKPWSPGMFYLRSWQRAPARLPCDSTSPAPSPRRARRAGTLKDDQHCYLCGQNGHRQFECPNRTDDIYKLPTQMQEKVDNLYQRDVARMAGDAAPSGAPARPPASCAPPLPCPALQRRASHGWPLPRGCLPRSCGRHGAAVRAGRAWERRAAGAAVQAPAAAWRHGALQASHHCPPLASPCPPWARRRGSRRGLAALRNVAPARTSGRVPRVGASPRPAWQSWAGMR